MWPGLAPRQGPDLWDFYERPGHRRSAPGSMAIACRVANSCGRTSMSALDGQGSDELNTQDAEACGRPSFRKDGNTLVLTRFHPTALIRFQTLPPGRSRGGARTADSTARAAAAQSRRASAAAASRAADVAPAARHSGRRSAACCGVLG